MKCLKRGPGTFPLASRKSYQDVRESQRSSLFVGELYDLRTAHGVSMQDSGTSVLQPQGTEFCQQPHKR